MATTKKRVNIPLSKDLEAQVTALAKRDAVPTVTKITELLQSSLALEEDKILSELVEERKQVGGKTVSRDEVWA